MAVWPPICIEQMKQSQICLKYKAEISHLDKYLDPFFSSMSRHLWEEWQLWILLGKSRVSDWMKTTIFSSLHKCSTGSGLGFGWATHRHSDLKPLQSCLGCMLSPPCFTIGMVLSVHEQYLVFARHNTWSSAQKIKTLSHQTRESFSLCSQSHLRACLMLFA